MSPPPDEDFDAPVPELFPLAERWINSVFVGAIAAAVLCAPILFNPGHPWVPIVLSVAAIFGVLACGSQMRGYQESNRVHEKRTRAHRVVMANLAARNRAKDLTQNPIFNQETPRGSR